MICKALRVPVASFNRWRLKVRKNVALLRRPGRKKVEPFDPARIEAEIRSLDHGKKRSAGAGELYRKNSERISRRDLARMVSQVRQDVGADRRRQMQRIEWLTPGVVWAMDLAEYDLGPQGKV